MFRSNGVLTEEPEPSSISARPMPVTRAISAAWCKRILYSARLFQIPRRNHSTRVKAGSIELWCWSTRSVGRLGNRPTPSCSRCEGVPVL